LTNNKRERRTRGGKSATKNCNQKKWNKGRTAKDGRREINSRGTFKEKKLTNEGRYTMIGTA